MSVPPLRVKILRLSTALDLPLPAYHTPHAAGLDMLAAVPGPLTVEPGQVRLVPTGIAVAIPTGHEGQLRPRSGAAIQHRVTLANAPGTIDSDYRGEISLALYNFGPTPFVVTRGMRLAQLVITPVPRIEWDEVDNLPPTDRGDSGFGHTGL